MQFQQEFYVTPRSENFNDFLLPHIIDRENKTTMECIICNQNEAQQKTKHPKNNHIVTQETQAIKNKWICINSKKLFALCNRRSRSISRSKSLSY